FRPRIAAPLSFASPRSPAPLSARPAWSFPVPSPRTGEGSVEGKRVDASDAVTPIDPPLPGEGTPLDSTCFTLTQSSPSRERELRRGPRERGMKLRERIGVPVALRVLVEENLVGEVEQRGKIVGVLLVNAWAEANADAVAVAQKFVHLAGGEVRLPR